VSTAENKTTQAGAAASSHSLLEEFLSQVRLPWYNAEMALKLSRNFALKAKNEFFSPGVC
jgi:hypothetical protein